MKKVNPTFSENKGSHNAYTKSGKFPDKHYGGRVVKKAASLYTKSGTFPSTPAESLPAKPTAVRTGPTRQHPSSPVNASVSTQKGGPEAPRKLRPTASRRPKKRGIKYSASVLKKAKMTWNGMDRIASSRRLTSAGVPR